MKIFPPARLGWLLLIAAVVLFVAIWLYPVSDELTRLAGAALTLIIWVNLGALLWPKRVLRYAYWALTFLIGGFMLLPAKPVQNYTLLRGDVCAGLRRYLGVRYYWGGESPKGIDCSGLMRRGLVDGLFLRGLLSANPGLIRESIWIWWHDITAADMGSGRDQTARLFTIKSINQMDQSRLEPGDMAVTQSGNHVLAYIGGDTWIEADPEAGRVITVHAPDPKCGWFYGPMTIVRWKALGG